MNVPLPQGTDDDSYLAALKETIDKHVVPFQPDAIVVSLGVDTFEGDPVGGFQMSKSAFPRIGDAIRNIGAPTLFVMEGGYDVGALGENVEAVLLGFCCN